MYPRDSQACSRPRSSWGLRAVASGVAATALSVGLATTTYRAIPGTETLPWDRLGLAIALFAVATGLCVGAGVGWTTRLAARRKPTLPRLVIGGALGGGLAGIIPGFFGIAGFGSLSAPYLGSLNIASSVLAGATAFVVLWAPRLLPQRVARTIGPARRFGLAALAAVITSGAAGLLGGMIAVSVHIVPSLATLQCLGKAIGLPALGVIGGAGIGMLGGALIGLCCGIFIALARRASIR